MTLECLSSASHLLAVCTEAADLVFILDTSGSVVDYWRNALDFAKGIIETLPIGPDNVRVAAVVYRYRVISLSSLSPHQLLLSPAYVFCHPPRLRPCSSELPPKLDIWSFRLTASCLDLTNLMIQLIWKLRMDLMEFEKISLKLNVPCSRFWDLRDLRFEFCTTSRKLDFFIDMWTTRHNS